ncbi:unnamed protein product [Amoebophrya sp. A25]|nr:unnamed protein product [Amoebophrya sp. A25]|eukprot:GSA25T00010547001.1
MLSEKAMGVLRDASKKVEVPESSIAKASTKNKMVDQGQSAGLKQRRSGANTSEETTTTSTSATAGGGELPSSSSASSKENGKSTTRSSRSSFFSKWSGNLGVLVIIAYGALISHNFYRVCYPDWASFGLPESDFIGNRVNTGAKLEGIVFVVDEAQGGKKKPGAGQREEIWRFPFEYKWENLGLEKIDIPISVSQALLEKVENKKLEFVITRPADASRNGKAREVARVEGAAVKWKPQPFELSTARKHNLLVPFRPNGQARDEIINEYGDTESVPFDPEWQSEQDRLCPIKQQPTYIKPNEKDKHGIQIRKKYQLRGLPKIQLRLVYDEDRYPWQYLFPSRPSSNGYFPAAFVDEFWLTDDQLIEFDMEEAEKTATVDSAVQFNTSLYFELMSSARWRFQHVMEERIEAMTKTLGEEESLQMRDLFANTSPMLLIVTLVVSILHTVFEFLAFKADVAFWSAQSAETLNKYVSVTSVLLNIVFEVILLLYLFDKESNFLILIFSSIAIAIDCWKVSRAMRLDAVWLFGVIPLPRLKAKQHKQGEDWDWIAIKYLSILLAPVVVAYASYNLVYECHKGWYSYLLETAASCVYAGGFMLMTPQLFINYKLKSVAHLPWRRFVYRALNTFVDDLFSFIIRMPAMHRMSCFRDDVVFFIYLYQRWVYPVDESRQFGDDDDGEEVVDRSVEMQSSSIATKHAKKKR